MTKTIIDEVDMPGGPKSLHTSGPTSEKKRCIEAAYALVLQQLDVISIVPAKPPSELTNTAANVAHPLTSSYQLVTAWAEAAPGHLRTRPVLISIRSMR